jgi:hypothetical protein
VASEFIVLEVEVVGRAILLEAAHLAGCEAHGAWRTAVRAMEGASHAHYLYDEFHTDGFRYDEVRLLCQNNAVHGWSFCQAITSAIRYMECAPAGGQIEGRELTTAAGLPEDGSHDEASIAQRRVQASSR